MARAEPQKLSFTVPIFEPHPPQYYIRAVSDSWMHAEALYTISFHNLQLPEVLFWYKYLALKLCLFIFDWEFMFTLKSCFTQANLHTGSYIPHRAARLETSPCDSTWQQNLWSLVQVFSLQSYSNSGRYSLTSYCLMSLIAIFSKVAPSENWRLLFNSFLPWVCRVFMSSTTRKRIFS